MQGDQDLHISFLITRNHVLVHANKEDYTCNTRTQKCHARVDIPGSLEDAGKGEGVRGGCAGGRYKRLVRYMGG